MSLPPPIPPVTLPLPVEVKNNSHTPYILDDTPSVGVSPGG